MLWSQASAFASELPRSHFLIHGEGLYPLGTEVTGRCIVPFVPLVLWLLDCEFISSWSSSGDKGGDAVLVRASARARKLLAVWVRVSLCVRGSGVIVLVSVLGGCELLCPSPRELTSSLLMRAVRSSPSEPLMRT